MNEADLSLMEWSMALDDPKFKERLENYAYDPEFDEFFNNPDGFDKKKDPLLEYEEALKLAENMEEEQSEKSESFEEDDFSDFDEL